MFPRSSAVCTVIGILRLRRKLNTERVGGGLRAEGWLAGGRAGRTGGRGHTTAVRLARLAVCDRYGARCARYARLGVRCQELRSMIGAGAAYRRRGGRVVCREVGRLTDAGPAGLGTEGRENAPASWVICTGDHPSAFSPRVQWNEFLHGVRPEGAPSPAPRSRGP